MDDISISVRNRCDYDLIAKEYFNNLPGNWEKNKLHCKIKQSQNYKKISSYYDGIDYDTHSVKIIDA